MILRMAVFPSVLPTSVSGEATTTPTKDEVKVAAASGDPEMRTTGYVTGMFLTTWVCPKIVVPQNGWFIRGNPIKMDDLGVPLFLETPM